MNKLYCSSCGQPTLFELNKPKCCSNCGISFASSVATKQSSPPIKSIIKPSQVSIRYANADENDDDDDGSGYIPGSNINYPTKIDLIATDVKPKKLKLGEVLGSEPGENYKLERPRLKTGSKKNRKKIIEEWGNKIRECTRVNVGGDSAGGEE